MAFGKKTPEEEFKETFGMTREEFDAERAEAKAQKDRADKLEAKQTETATTLTDLQTQLAALKAPRRENNTPEPTNWFEDPDKAINERMAPVAAAALTSGARVEEMIARSKFDKDFKKYGKEIDDLIKSHQSLTDKNNPAFYENVVNIVRGRHVAEIEEAALKGTAYFTEQPGGGGAGGGEADDKDFGLSKEQVAAAKRMNMTLKDFRESLDYTMGNYGHTKGAAHVN
jgi:hypothetical protein